MTEDAPAGPTLEATPAPAARLSPAAAQIVAWGVLALVDAAAIQLLVARPSSKLVRVFHHLYDAGQLLTAGVASAAVVWAWGRWGPKRRWLGDLALALTATLVGLFTLPSDLGGTARKLAIVGPERLWLYLLLAGAGVVVALSARLGGALARRAQAPSRPAWLGPALRGAGVLLGLAIAGANEILLPKDYPAIHLFLAWTAAVLLASSLSSLKLPGPLGRLAPRVGYAALALVLALSGYTTIVPPRQAVLKELLLTSGAVLAPVMAQLRGARSEPDVPPEPDHPDVPPSGPPLVDPAAGPPIVIVFVIDALRADVVAGGAHADLLPNLEALRRESVELTMARSPASGTIWTIASLFSSRYYSQLYWHPKPGGPPTLSYPYEDPSVRFPELLAAAKIDTFSASAMPDVENARDRFGVIRGVVEEHAVTGRKAVQSSGVLDALLDRLHRPITRPLFAYVHFLDAHAPYSPGARGDSDLTRYLKEVASVDGRLGKLREDLRARHLAERAIIILTADHGEAFGEHGTHHHAVSVYEELLRVPLLIHVPGKEHREVATPVSLIDLGPTILDAFGLPAPGSYMGQSLVPILRGGDVSFTRALAAETGRRQRALIFPDGFKVIENLRAQSIEAYDLAQDPGETRNLIDEMDPRVEDRVLAERVFFARHRLRRPGYSPPYRP